MKNEQAGALIQTVQALIRWVEQNLNQVITMADLVPVGGYCPRQLGKGFKQVTGMSPARYILRRKLTRAAHLLCLTSRPVTDIAMTYAFGSLQSFSRAFHRYFGLSPQAYRQVGKCPSDLSLPPPAPVTWTYTARRQYIKEFWLQPHMQKNIKIPLDMHMTLSERGTLRQDLYTLFYNRLFRHNQAETFTILADIIKKHGHDMWVHTTTGTRTQPDTPDAVHVPASQRFCFTFSGALKDIMDFHQWVNIHGLKKHGITATAGATFTTYQRLSPHTDIYAIRYCLPVLPPESHCHTRRNRETFPAV
ncbi:helix-turn-helix transcriptional regulator [Salmonella enterica]|nr:AraC family transcriptional regulator [Salmonella enterica subsp. enterica serovar Orientalis]EBJ4008372.1 AraC family transcriptional regulator [Salmonella enterica]EBQ9235404.1 AraC family transcriptional regulator [Salmonella enterica subsp. enterica serovar Orientalis]EKA1667300.1 helix-turn-helix transcriptional regulator [Salmonella enterica]